MCVLEAFYTHLPEPRSSGVAGDCPCQRHLPVTQAHLGTNPVTLSWTWSRLDSAQQCPEYLRSSHLLLLNPNRTPQVQRLQSLSWAFGPRGNKEGKRWEGFKLPVIRCPQELVPALLASHFQNLLKALTSAFGEAQQSPLPCVHEHSFRDKDRT